MLQIETYLTVVIYNRKTFIVNVTDTCTGKHFGYVMYGFLSKLVCLFKQGKVTNNKKHWLTIKYNNFP
jgi:hypothetical protein